MSLAITQFNSALKAPLVRAFFKVDIPGLSRESLLVEDTTLPSEPLVESSIFVNGTEVKVPVRPQMGGDWEFTFPEGIFGEGFRAVTSFLLGTFIPFRDGSSKLENTPEKEFTEELGEAIWNEGIKGYEMNLPESLVLGRGPITVGITPIPLTIDEVAYYYLQIVSKGLTGSAELSDSVLKTLGGEPMFRKAVSRVFGRNVYDTISTILQPVRVELNDWYVKEVKPIQVTSSDMSAVKLTVTIRYKYLKYKV